MPFIGKDVNHSIIFRLELFLVLKAKKQSLYQWERGVGSEEMS